MSELQRQDFETLWQFSSRQAKRIAELERERDQLKARCNQLVDVGGRVSMALTDAQSGYVCESRVSWDDLVGTEFAQSLAEIQAKAMSGVLEVVESYEGGMTPSILEGHKHIDTLRQQAQEEGE